MKKIMKKAGGLFLAASLGLSALTGCGAAKETVIDGTKTVVTVNDEEVKLGAAALLTRFQQAQVYQMYNMYFGTTQIFNQVMDESSGKNYGETLKSDILEEIENMVLLRQHASDYEGIELSEEEQEAIKAVSEAFIAENTEEIRSKLGVSAEDVTELLSLFKIREKMTAAIGDAVDQEVSDEEAQQTSLTYVSIEKAKEDESDSSAEESADESAAAEAEVSVEQQNNEKRADAEAILASLRDDADPAAADLGELAREENEEYSASSGQFTTNDTEDTTLDASIVEAAAGLSDGEVVDHVVETDGFFYVIRVDKVFDEELTESKKASILSERKQESYDSLISEWRDAAAITVDDAVLASLPVNDSEVFTLLAEDPAEESAVDSSSDASAADSAEASADDSAAESAESSQS
ncbi:MAG: peptidylprolyl isomerase [Lachnospiraceae bacterium]|nr:peptidylprolyl isomerase [Lachnospiraceae bacterium]